MDIKVDTKQLKRWERDLVQLNRQGIPHAAKAALNDLAFEARREWQEDLGKKLTLRNTWTERSIRVEKARGLSLDALVAKVGSVADYVADIEQGETVTGKGKHGAPIPTLASRGGNKKRLVRKPNKLGSITLAKGASRGSKRQRNAAAIAKARRSGKQFAFLDLGKTKGIFKIGKSKRSRTPPKMIWSLGKKSFKTEPRNIMRPAVLRAMPKRDLFWAKALKFQLSRLSTYR